MHSGVLSVRHKSVWQAGESFDVHCGGQREHNDICDICGKSMHKCQCNVSARQPAIRPQLSLYNLPRSVTPLEFLIKAKHQTKGNKMSCEGQGGGRVPGAGQCELKCQPGNMEI